jgi:hypothetical protein
MRIRLGVLCLLLTATGVSAQSLEQQAMCAKQAKVAFQDWVDDSKKGSPNLLQHSEYQSHYNTKLTKCFIAIETMIFGGKSTTRGWTLMDAFEQRVYAQYIWTFPDEPSCDLIPTSQTQTHCSSKDEFDAFVAKYMEE